MAFKLTICCLIVELAFSLIEVHPPDQDSSPKNFIIFTVASENNDAYQRYVRSLRHFGMDNSLITLGMNQEWKGGDMRKAGGGYKVNLLKEAMKEYKDEQDLIVMFTDSYDVIFLTDINEILDKFYKTGANFVISAEDWIWPDRSLKSQYPKIEGKQYLCSGLMIGYAETFWEILNYKEISNTYDDQLYYTHVYLDSDFRTKHKLQLDGTTELFHNLHGTLEELNMGYGNQRISNLKYGTMPAVLHGNGPMHVKLDLNRISNYYPHVFNPTAGEFGECYTCNEDRIDVTENPPVILTNLYVKERTPFIDYFINKTFELNHPRSRWHLRIYNLAPSHTSHLQELINFHVYDDNNSEKFASFELFQPEDIQVKELQALYEYGMGECTKVKCDWYFGLDSEITITDNDVLSDLMSYNKSVITTQLTIPGQYWSNFWGGVNSDGFYKRSDDYFDMVLRKRRSVFNVPYVSSLVAIRSDVIRSKKVAYLNERFSDSNYDVAFADNARRNNVFMYVVNTKQHGHLKKMENYTALHTNNDLWQIFVNPTDWKLNYIHKDYSKFLEFKRYQFPSPCPDVFMFPLVTEKFAWHIVHELESIPNIFSSGQNQDTRLAGGYENVPTVDVHFTQINFQQEWLKVLKDYIAPMQRLVFEGYSSKNDAYLSFVVKYDMRGQRKLVPHHDAATFTTNTALNRVGIDFEQEWLKVLRDYIMPVQRRVFEGYRADGRALLSFVVKYHEAGQRLLKPHHDHSTFTTNTALNHRGVDFEGGGSFFIRQNCLVGDAPVGWTLIHPGRLTHYHEGREISRGTRYILVSFNDP